MSSKIVDSELVLREHSSTAVTSTASSTGKLLYPRNQLLQKVIINVGTFKTSATNETYAITVEVSDLVGGTYTAIVTLTSAQLIAGGANATYEYAINKELVSLIDADSLYVRVTATLGGTDPSLTYGAYLTKV